MVEMEDCKLELSSLSFIWYYNVWAVVTLSRVGFFFFWHVKNLKTIEKHRHILNSLLKSILFNIVNYYTSDIIIARVEVPLNTMLLAWTDVYG